MKGRNNVERNSKVEYIAVKSKQMKEDHVIYFVYYFSLYLLCPQTIRTSRALGHYFLFKLSYSFQSYSFGLSVCTCVNLQLVF